MTFFLISGFLMSRLYLETPFRLENVGRFLQKRVARVVPLYLLVVLASAAAYARFGSASVLYWITPENLLAHLGFQEGVSVLWTIPVEIQFYLSFPLIWWIFSKAGAARTAALLLATSLGTVLLPKEYAPFSTLPFHLHYFLVGIVISMASLRWSPVRSPLAWDAVFLTALPLTILVMPEVTRLVFDASLGLLWKSPIPLVVLTCLIWSCLRSRCASGVFGGTLGRFLGNISYSVYLLHLPLLFAMRSVESLAAHRHLLVVAFLAALTALSFLSYRLFELPARRALNGIRVGAWRTGLSEP